MSAKKKRSVRSPFVSTVAMTTFASATLALGCGGKVDGDRVPTSNPPGYVDGGPDGQDPACPATLPKFGDACSEEGKSCSYGYSTDECMNPISSLCVRGQWQTTASSCNPPPPPIKCPVSEPFDGATCSSWGTCSYPDKCPSAPAGEMRIYDCSGSWHLEEVGSPTYVASCPGTPPANGAPCECAGHLPPSCDYDDCGGYPTTSAKCDPATRTWSVMRTSCNPPAVDASPPDAWDVSDAGAGG